jgi:hypothetical protein
MADNNPNPNPVAGGSGVGRNNVVQNQKVVIDPAAQNAAAQLAQQILANTNITLKKEVVKILDFWGEKGKDTVSAQQFISRIDECQVSNDWKDTEAFANFNLCLQGEADEWLSLTCQLLELTAAQKTWTQIRPLFKREFAALSNDKLIVDSLANLAHRPGENPRNFLSRLEKQLNVLHENYASYWVKPERPAPLPAGTYSEDVLTKAINDKVKSYNKFLLAQVFGAAALENVCKLLSHKDQTHLTVDNAYQTFFTEHRVESDKKQTMAVNVVNSFDDDQDNSVQDQDVAAFRPQQQRSQQRNKQQASNYRENQSTGQFNNKPSFPKSKLAAQHQGSNHSKNGKFCAYCKILNHSQEECRKIIRDNKLCMNNKGQLYWPKINSTTENSDPNNGVGSVFQSRAS